MISLNGLFVGYKDTNTTVNFSGHDSKERYEKNLKVEPSDWYYRNVEITYHRNSLGHRCKNIEDLDTSNYILFAGCSHTEGIGLELETSYPYILSKKLNCDYYNLSVGGTGNDVIAHNILAWVASVKPKPKALVIQWTADSRFITIDNDKLICSGAWVNDRTTTEFLTLGMELNYFNSQRKLHEKLIQASVDCPIHYVNAFPSWDAGLARDRMHYGKDTHQKQADQLYVKQNSKD